MVKINNYEPKAALAINKNVVKVYDGKNVFMEDGQEFQIFLTNPTKTVYMAKIKINGSYISNSGLVLNPGEKVWLDCNWDNKKKFKFSTYVVDDTEDVKKAIEDNGIVEVEFYGENTPPIKTTYPSWEPYYIPNRYPPFYGGDTGFKYTSEFKGDLLFDSNCSFDQGKDKHSYYSCSCDSGSQIETGRVEEGSNSDQNFSNVNKDFSLFKSYTDSYHIFPQSRREAITIKEIRKYCGNCGKKAKKSHKFCTECGTKIG